MYARTNRCYNERGSRTNYFVLAYPTVFNSVLREVWEPSRILVQIIKLCHNKLFIFRIVFWDVLSYKIIVDRRFRGMIMEAARTSETSVDNYFTRQYIPEDNSELHTRRRENLKSHKAVYCNEVVGSWTLSAVAQCVTAGAITQRHNS
jgi:hypothetical protein